MSSMNDPAPGLKLRYLRIGTLTKRRFSSVKPDLCFSFLHDLQRFNNAREPRYEPPIIVSKAKETLKLFDIQWHMSGFDSFNLVRNCPYSFRGYQMSQESNFVSQELTFGYHLSFKPAARIPI